MNQFNTTVIGLDVHKNSIVAGILPAHSERVIETISMENSPSAIGKLVQRWANRGPVQFVYEAGPCGFDVHRRITTLGSPCVVIAPGLIPQKPTDRVKTDRRDAEKLARLWRAGELTAIRIPSPTEEAARDLVRAREDVLAERLASRHRLLKFLLRQGRVFRDTKAWTLAHGRWLNAQVFDPAFLQQTFDAYRRGVDESQARLNTLSQQVEDLANLAPYKTPVSYLRCFKGVDTLSAITLLVEIQDFRRFQNPSALMKLTGLTCAEYSSGDRVQRRGITKAGNAHIRRILIEAAWVYRHKNAVSAVLARRRAVCPPEVVHIARKAQDRLHRRFHHLLGRNKPVQTTVVAVARELAGFVWSMARFFPEKAAA